LLADPPITKPAIATPSPLPDLHARGKIRKRGRLVAGRAEGSQRAIGTVELNRTSPYKAGPVASQCCTKSTGKLAHRAILAYSASNTSNSPTGGVASAAVPLKSRPGPSPWKALGAGVDARESWAFPRPPQQASLTGPGDSNGHELESHAMSVALLAVDREVRANHRVDSFARRPPSRRDC
jgi:hypothetical protein